MYRDAAKKLADEGRYQFELFLLCDIPVSNDIKDCSKRSLSRVGEEEESVPGCAA